MATPKQAHALASYFEKAYEKKYTFKPVFNRYAARWGFDAILGHMSEDDTKELIDYYMTTVSQNSHDIQWFFYNYDKLIKAKADQDADIKRLIEVRERTRERTERWRERLGNDRSETD